ncbi:hypothetical protein H3Z83_00210 [Tenacibaculum sp. S7007]|uniref:Bacteriocin n=1 Tax=Tenacibaculum pelagium TaxID=2759527 RepID=A0A839AKP8_9FLAO|nr:hypothetical protein [Tenacibaculum pelagium]MBA6154946.1 hypothetical protein [Tenacibaculum pelagium]
MLKTITNLGEVLNKAEQKTINGGQIQCPRGTVLRCNWLGCWCEAEIDDRPDER